LYLTSTGVVVAKGPFEGDLDLVPGTWIVATYAGDTNAPIDTSQVYVAKTTVPANGSASIDATKLDSIQLTNKSNVVRITEANGTLAIQKVLNENVQKTSDASSYDSLQTTTKKTSEEPPEKVAVGSEEILKAVFVVVVASAVVLIAYRRLKVKKK
jgi:hypothetical protein